VTTHPSRLSVKAQPLPPNSVVWGKQGEGEALKRSQQLAWASAFRSQLQAFDYEITEIEGVLPEELKGSTLFRNGPSRFERGDQRVAHYLDGDGYIAKIAFAPDGRVTFSSRFVKTAEYAWEDAANAFGFRTTFGNAKPGGFLASLLDLHLKNPANTHVVPWGSRLLALYEAGMPYRIDPYTLETLGVEDLLGQLVEPVLPPSRWEMMMRRSRGQQAMTAHPHVDPVRDRLVTWSWGMAAKLGEPNTLIIELIEYNAAWEEMSRRQYSMPGAAVNPHDFALTPNYYVFFENALSFDVMPFLLGQKSPADCLKLLPKPTKVHLIPRPDGAMAGVGPLVLETDQWFSIHQACAYEQLDGQPDGQVVVYSSGWPASEGGFLTSWGGYAPNFDAIAPTFLWQTTLNPRKKSVVHRIAPGTENCCIAHPHVNPNRETLAVRYLYMPYCNNIGESSPPVGYLRLDTQTQQRQVWTMHPQSFAEEPVFVPRAGGRADGENEDDGWLLGVTYDYLQDRSSLMLFDAADIEAGPICRLWFTHHLAHGLHGSWSPVYYGS